MNWFKKLGPGTLIAAAFIGPGTVTICTKAGAYHGLTLLWALLFSIIATIVLQELSARIGVVSKQGIGALIRANIHNNFQRLIAIILIVSAIFIGNSAYEAGNISGASLGLISFFGESHLKWYLLIIGTIAYFFLYLGNYKIIERLLIGLVTVMSICFVITAIAVQPSWSLMLEGLFVPQVSDANLLTIMGIIGTTVVPYNLFLHASIVNEKWQNPTLHDVRWDTIISISLGGLVSMSIIICAAAVQSTEINTAADLAAGLEIVLGDYAVYLVALGLFAAGITSAITAPLASAYAIAGIMGWETHLNAKKFRWIWSIIIIVGIISAMVGFKPIEIIIFAQIANGLLLPLIVGFIIWIANKKEIMGRFTNTFWLNTICGIVWFISLALGLKAIYTALT